MLISFFFSVMLVLMFYFVNTLYFISVLLCMFLMLVLSMVKMGIVSSVFGGLVALVYIGAMMVFIGYICAISPNLFFSLPFSIFWGVFVSMLLSFCFSFFTKAGGLAYNMADYFYSFYGLPVFVLLVGVLLLVLVMVSVQYFFPKGPFRSFN